MFMSNFDPNIIEKAIESICVVDIHTKRGKEQFNAISSFASMIT